MIGLKFEKNEIRQQILEKRILVPENEKIDADKRISSRFLNLASLRFAETILLYSPIKGEPDITEAAIEAVKRGKKIAYPKCDPETCTMNYYFVSSPDELVPGTYGISEPPENAEMYVPSPDKHDIIVVPAVCYDKSGFRIGYGRGYYDRYLSDFGGSSVGLSMHRFLQAKLPRGKYDKSVNIIITEKGVITP